MDLTNVRFHGSPRPGLRVAPRRAVLDRYRRVSVSVAAATTPLTGLPAAVLARAGLDPRAYREAPLRRRTPPCLRALRMESEGAALERLATHPSLTQTALSSLLIGVSDFFRDADVFQTLQASVVPALRTRQRPLRILCVGCCSGAELYSVAMLLAEAGLIDGAELLGVDCRGEALTQARAGIFTDSALQAVNAGRRRRYFEPYAGGWRVVPALRQHATWRPMDATRSCAEGPWDMVLCRNLFIYLQEQTAHHMQVRVVEHLAAGGYLVVGKAERPAQALRVRKIGRSIYQADAE